MKIFFLLDRDKFEYNVDEINFYSMRMLARVGILFHIVDDSDSD